MSELGELSYLNEPQCLKHGHRWHTRFQQLMNLLRTKIPKQNYHGIGSAICSCDPEDENFRCLPDTVQGKVKKRPIDKRWEEQLTDEKAKESYEFFDNYVETNFDRTKDEYGHLKNILVVLKDRGQLSHRLNSANRFLYLFYKLMKDQDNSLLTPPPAPKIVQPVQETEAPPPLPLEKETMHLKSLRPEDVGNFIGTKGIHIKRLLKEKKGSKITMGKEDGHVKIEIEAIKEDLQEIKDRLLQREALVVHARRQHDESVKNYQELMGHADPESMEYQSAEESMQ